MIDTVRLILDEGTFTILDPWRFKPNAKRILDMEKRLKSSGVIKCVLNPSKDSPFYAPRLTLRRRAPNTVELVIELSIPKLLYGNNFDELEETDFDRVIKILADRLLDMNIIVFTELLRKAPVGAIHYGKNIVLPSYSLCKSILRFLAKVPINQWFDYNSIEFRNGGHLYKIHSNSFELAFYDKVKDLKKSKRGKKRAHEQENEIQMDLLEHFETSITTQVLRMEARLNTRTQIKHLLKKINLPDDDLRFFALFKKDIAQKALLHYWEPYERALPSIILAQRESPSSLLDSLIKHAPEATIGTLLQQLGVLTLVGDTGWDDLRSYCSGREKSYSRIKKGLKGFSAEATDTLFLDLEAIKTTLESFGSVKTGLIFQEASIKI